MKKIITSIGFCMLIAAMSISATAKSLKAGTPNSERMDGDWNPCAC